VPIMDREDEIRSEERRLTRQEDQSFGVGHTKRRLISGGLSAAPVLMALSSRSALAQTCLTPSRMMSGNMSASNPVGTCTVGMSPEKWASPSNFVYWPAGTAPALEKCSGKATAKNVMGTCTVTASSWTNYTDSTVPPLSVFQFSAIGCTMGTKDLGPVVLPVPTKRINNLLTGFGAPFADIFVDINGDFLPKIPTFTNDSTVPSVKTRKVTLWELLAYPTWLVSATQLDLARCCIAAYLNASVPGNQYPVTKQQAIEMWQKGRFGNYCALDACTNPWGATEITTYLKETWPP
jgi:hypothetical protein